jgi:hypothetical protein
MCKHIDHKTCPPDGRYRGRCAGTCAECGEHILTTGRNTRYCPSCDCCETCGCPCVDGFSHNAGCPEGAEENDMEDWFGGLP